MFCIPDFPSYESVTLAFNTTAAGTVTGGLVGVLMRGRTKRTTFANACPRIRGPGASAPAKRTRAQNQDQGQNKHGGERAVARASIERRRQGLRQARVDQPFGAERQRLNDASERIDDCRDSGIGCPHQRQPFLDRPYARLLKMLIGTGAFPEPSVICEIERTSRPLAAAGDERPDEIAADVIVEPARTLAVRHRIAREYDLIADQRQKVGDARHMLVAAAIACDEPAAHPGELHKAKLLQHLLERKVLPERNQVHLVVD